MTSHVHRQGDLILLCQCYPKGSTDSTQSLSKSQHRNRKTHPQVHMESRGNPNSQNNLEKLEKSWWTHTLILKLIKLIKTVWYWHKNRHISMEQNRKPRNEPTRIWSINLQQRSQEYTMGKEQFLHKMVLGKPDSTCKRMKMNHYLTPYRKLTQNG